MTPGQACSKAHQSDDIGTHFIDQKADECRRRAPQLCTMNHKPEEMHNPILAYKAVNPNILRLHEAMQAKDQKEFKAAMLKSK